MRLLKIWDAEYPWDVRLEKVMRTLTNAGHDVHLVARNRKRDALEERMDEATVHRMPPWSAAGAKIDAVTQFPAFMNPRWMTHILGTGRRQEVEAIIVRDLPLAPTAVWAGRRLGVPVILDMAENYAEMMRDIWTSGRQGPLDFLVRNPAIVSRLERSLLDVLDHVVVVVEESGERLVGLGLDPSRVTVVCNTPWASRIPDDASLKRPSPDGPLRLVYLGLLEKPRGIDTVLQGLAGLRAKGVETHLSIIGGGMEAEYFAAEASRLGFDEKTIVFHGVLPYEQALGIFEASHVGIVPHLAVESWNTTIPNKLFDYMSHELAVITSDAKPAARIVRAEDSGIVFRSGDVADFSAAVSTLLDPEVRARCGRNGRQAVRERYNWNVDATRLLDAVETTVAEGRRA